MQQNNEERLTQWLIELKACLVERDEALLHALLDEMHYADVVELLDELEEDDRSWVFTHLSGEQASRVLEEVDSEDFGSLFNELDETQKSDVLDLMSTDDIADQLNDLSAEEQEHILSHMDQEDQDEVKALLDYDEESAGGIMTTDYIDIHVDMTIIEAFSYLRANAPDAEIIYYVYVTDHDGRLAGIISLRELITAPDDTKIADIMQENVISINVHSDQEEAAHLVQKYNLLALPVIDDNQKLLGIITVDDVMDVMEEEATEDILRFAGTTEEELESIEEDNFLVGAWMSVKARLPWLLLTIIGGLMSAQVISGFQHSLETDTAIALFMPLLAGMGGNVGTQSSTLTVRNIALGAIGKGMVWRVLLQEISVGIMVGVVCSLFVAAASFLFEGRLMLSVIVGLAMWANMVTAATIGTLVPLIFRRFGIDPAVASAPFISTTIDITGLSIYFTLVTLMLHHIIA